MSTPLFVVCKTTNQYTTVRLYRKGRDQKPMYILDYTSNIKTPQIPSPIRSGLGFLMLCQWGAMHDENALEFLSAQVRCATLGL